MIFLWASVLPLGVSALFFLVRYLIKRKKESVKLFPFFLTECLPDVTGSLLLSLLFALFIHLLFPHYWANSLILFFASQSALMSWLRPAKRLYECWKTRTNPFSGDETGKSIRDLLLLAIVSLEVFAFHTDSYRGHEKETIGTISEVSSSSTLDNNGGVYWENASTIELHGVDTSNDSFYLDFDKENICVQIRFRTKETGNTSSNAWTSFRTYNVYLAYPEDLNFPVYGVSQYESGQYDLQIIAFYTHEEQATSHLLHLNAVRFKAPLAFAISYLRLFGLEGILLLLFAAKQAFAKRKNENHEYAPRHLTPFAKSMIVTGGISLSALAVFLAISWIYQGRYYTAYPFDSSLLPESSYSYLYYRLFDALRHGQFALRIDPDPALVALDNPYDISARNAAHAKYLWDCAYYNGHYYCYFGVGPVLFVMFPVYFLSGCAMVPTGSFLIQLAIVITGIEFLFLGPLFNKATGEKLTYPMSFFLGILAFFASAFPLMFKDNFIDWQYWVAVNWGIANLIAFLGLTLCAYAFPKTRLAIFPCIGFVFIALMLSRPDLCFSVVVLAPLFFKMMFDKNVSVKRRVISFVSMFIILGIGMGFTFYYNVKRFDNPFEFGSSYQLTVMDQRDLRLTAKGVLAGAFHFLFQPWVPAQTFPIIRCSVIQTPLSYHDYTIATVGVFMNIFSWGMFLTPFLWKGAGWEKKTSYILLYIVLILYAGLVYSYSGSCPRYCLAFWMIGSFTSLYFLFRVLGKTGGTPFGKRLLNIAILAAYMAGFIGLFLPLSGYSTGRFGYPGLGDSQFWGYAEAIRRLVGMWH